MQEKNSADAQPLVANGAHSVSVIGPTSVTKDLYTKATFPGRLLMLGCGSIGQCVIPMLLRHTDMTAERMKIIASNDLGKGVTDEYAIEL